jgi:hypothetical protein
MSGGLADPVEIVPGLFLGSANASRKKDVLLESNVSLIVNCAIEMENHYRDSFEYIHLQLEDEAEESVLQSYRQSVRDILSAFPFQMCILPLRSYQYTKQFYFPRFH